VGEYRSQIKPLYGTPINPSHWAAQGLAGQWLFNEGSGLIAHDSSGNGNHGTLVNMSNSSPTSGWVPGSHGGGLAFDGSSNYVAIPKNVQLSLSSWTGIIFLQAYVVNGYIALLGNSYAVGNACIYIKDGKGGVYAASNNFGGISILSSAHVMLGITVSDVLKIYINGNFDAQYLISPLFGAGAGAVIVGKNPVAASEYFRGIMSSVLIYNRVLSAEEIAYLYQNPYCMYEDQSPISLQGGNASAMNQVNRYYSMGAA